MTRHGRTGSESSGGGGNPEQAFAFGQVRGDFQRLVDRVRVGQARGYRTMLVFWLFGEAPPAALEVATLDEARSRGDLLITERDQASVPQLLVENRGKVHVLLLAGEILLGGKQNRVLSEDIRLPPLSGPRNIAVYCVEQGRWAERTKEFEAKGTFAAPSSSTLACSRANGRSCCAPMPWRPIVGPRRRGGTSGGLEPALRGSCAPRPRPKGACGETPEWASSSSSGWTGSRAPP